MKQMTICYLVKPFLVTFIVFLTGCGVHHYRIPDGLTPDSVSRNESIVILSTGTNSPSFEHGCMLAIRRVDGGKSVGSVVLINRTIESHFDDHHGFIHVLRFSPGKYFLTLDALRPMAWYDNYSGVFVFEVKESETVYIGEMFYEYVKFTAYEAWSSGGREGYVKLTVNDRFERDVGFFLQKNPLFKVEDIIKREPYLVKLRPKETPKDYRPEMFN